MSAVEAIQMARVRLFWSRVKKTSGCWLWMGPRLVASWKPGYETAYGVFTYKGVTKLAHRFSWELKHGPIPEGMKVCHKCDNPPCVKPSSLFLGTDLDNARDREAKGRGKGCGPRGEISGRSRLTEKEVLKIRAEYAIGRVTMKVLAKRFGVQPGTICYIVNRQTWTHI